MPHTFIPEYEITQTVTAVRLTDNKHQLTGLSGSRHQTILPLSLRVIRHPNVDDTLVEATGFKVREDGGLSSMLYTVTVSEVTDGVHPVAPEWVLAILDGVR